MLGCSLAACEEGLSSMSEECDETAAHDTESACTQLSIHAFREHTVYGKGLF
jgi:hypothetical protein